MTLKELLEKYTKDGEIDFDSADGAFQEHVNGIVTKNLKKEVSKKEAEIMGNFINELGIEANDIEGVKNWVGVMSNNTDDFKKENVTLKKQLEDLSKEHNGIKTEYTNFKQDTLLKFDAGVKDPEQLEFLKYKFNKNANEELTFESQLEAYKKENKVTTFRDVDKNFDETLTSSPLEELKKLRGL